MKKQSVKKRIFVSNTLMVLVSLLIFFVINLFIIKGYSESVETEIKASAAQVMDKAALEEFVLDWTVERGDFLLFLCLDGALCVLVLVLTGQVFTKNLSRHIMEPLDALQEGAKRVQENHLTQEILYHGDAEFETVCRSFNEMQSHILAEQEKNRKYEKARTDMIAGISHDLRTPLTAIRGSLKGILDGVASSPEQQERFLQAAYRRTGEMETLLHQLFYFSGLETGNMPLSLQKIEIAAFLEEYAQTKQSAEISLDTQGIRAEVLADAEQLIRVLDNLLENSRKYSEKTPLEISITLSRTATGIRIRFRDNGVGVAEEKLPHIFEEFYRADESRNKKEGNGLGLYIVKTLIAQMQGTVSAENADGFAICIELPTAKEGGTNDGKRKKDSDY